jgi:hypothetical protein
MFALTDPLEAFHTSLRLPGDAQNGLTSSSFAVAAHWPAQERL